MKLNEALREIARLKGQLAQWDQRLREAAAAYKSTAPPAYTYDEVVKQRSLCVANLINLKARVAHTNAKTKIQCVDKTITLIEAILLLAELKNEIALYNALPNHATHDLVMQETTYISGQLQYVEVSKFAALTTREKDELVSTLEDNFAELNAIVEAANHTTLLQE